MSSADDRVGAGGMSTSSAAEDDPPRSRLFVVCPKGTGQETLTRAFEVLLTRLSDPTGTSRSNPKKDGERGGDDEKYNEEADDDDADKNAAYCVVEKVHSAVA